MSIAHRIQIPIRSEVLSPWQQPVHAQCTPAILTGDVGIADAPSAEQDCRLRISAVCAVGACCAWTAGNPDCAGSAGGAGGTHTGSPSGAGSAGSAGIARGAGIAGRAARTRGAGRTARTAATAKTTGTARAGCTADTARTTGTSCIRC